MFVAVIDIKLYDKHKVVLQPVKLVDGRLQIAGKPYNINPSNLLYVSVVVTLPDIIAEVGVATLDEPIYPGDPEF